MERETVEGVSLVDIRTFYANARLKTFASGAAPIEKPMMLYSKELRYSEGGFYYHDRYFDDTENPGRFAGIEVISEGSFEGKALVAYSSGGGLTQEGIKLGDAVVYAHLQRFLRENAETTRFGGKVRSVFGDEIGAWEYQCVGELRPWGWSDVEYINLKGEMVYNFLGTGTYFIR